MTRLITTAAILCCRLMAQLPTGAAGDVGLSQSRLESAARLLASEVSGGRVGAGSILVARRGRTVLRRGFGRSWPDETSAPVTPDSVFLLASITKPVTALSLMLLVERGSVSLRDPVSRYLPEFTGGERDKVTVRDILRHASGLPDMLPENTELRRAHAPLSAFVKHTFTTPLLFAPGTQFRYQSMGILLAGEIVERVAGMPLRKFEQREIFEPLGMRASSLGLGGRRILDLVSCMPGAVAAGTPDEASFGANSPYWRDMGHPWGGMHSNTSDLAVLLQTFLDGGTYAGRRLLGPAAAKAMITDQNEGLGTPWGLGWSLARSSECFSDLTSPRTFGHAGASGTVAWADPESGLLCVILTNRPIASDNCRLLRLISNVIASSVER